MASVMGAHADYQLVMSQPEVKPVPTSGHEVNASSPTPIKSEFSNDRGRRRSRSPPDEYEDDDGGPAQSLGGPTRKRRRSRKGLDKKFECPHEGCGKSYSRAEHLYRHQLNHNPKQIYSCDFPDCTRSFVRLDLCNRHKDRHTAKGSTLNRKDMLASQNQSQQPQGQSVKTQSQCQPQAQDLQTQVAQVKIQSQIKDQDYSMSPTSEKQQFSTTKAMADAISGSISPDSKTSNIGFTKLQQAPSNLSGATSFTSSAHIPQRQQMKINIFPTSSPFEAVESPFNTSMVGNHQLHQSPGVIEPGHPQTQSAIGISPYPAMSPVVAQPNFQHTQHSAQHPVNFIPHQSFQPSFDLPVSGFPSQTTPAEAQPQAFPNNENRPEFNEPLTNNITNPTEMMVLEQIQTLPMFGSEGIMNKSPYVSMPNDLINYLFNQSSPINNPVAYQTNGFSSYSQMYMGLHSNQIGYFPNVPQQVMAVNNLLEQDVPEASISEEKSQEIFDYMKKHFIERGTVPADRNGEAFLQGDRSQPTHMLSRRMMQTYIRSYWLHFSDQVPFLHKPTFSPDQTPNLLLLSMMTIGAVCVEKTSNNDGEATNTTSDARLSNFLAWHIRWETFMDNHFRPPAKLWAFQTFLLLELYEKMYATRELHERALIHHATTIAMMRRGRALIGKSARDSPSQRDDSSVGRTSRHSSTPGPSTADDWWSNWIMNESTRRTAFAAFVIDSIHATMFGHSTVMVAHEMRLPLPCDETLWRATSGPEVGRLETVMASNGFKPISFLEGLKRTLQGFEVQTNSFGRTVLMSGLLSVSWHMQQRDLQVNVLGSGVSQALGGRDKWRITLTKAFDSWRQDFDKAIEKARNDPYGGIDDNRRDELDLVFESRTVLHHLAHMAMHVDVIDCQIFARAKRLLGRTIGEADLRGAQRRMKDQWAPTAKARDATWYALNFLCTVLMPEERGLPRASDFNPQDPYSARDDVLLNRPWVVYLASLVVWCYGFALEGPCPDELLPKNKHEAVQQMKKYLSKYGNVSSPDGLIQMRGLNRSTAVLMVLKDSFQKTRWQLLHEGAKLLENCIALNSGAPV